MKDDFAQRLLERRLELRWITAPSPSGLKRVAGLLIGVTEDLAFVRCEKYHTAWVVPLKDVNYR